MRILFTIIVLLFFVEVSLADAVKTKCQGEWEDSNSWQNGILPKAGDSIYINHSLFLQDSIAFINNFVQISSGGAICGDVNISVDATSAITSVGISTFRIIIFIPKAK